MCDCKHWCVLWLLHHPGCFIKGYKVCLDVFVPAGRIRRGWSVIVEDKTKFTNRKEVL
jgi:hypothetical protein